MVVSSAYINKVPTKPLVGLWELFVMVISLLRTSRFMSVALSFAENFERCFHSLAVVTVSSFGGS